jgi:D-ribose pyranase
MKSNGVLNIKLAKLIAKLGHGDAIAIVDRGFPLPTLSCVEVIDLALSKNVPTVAQVVENITKELIVEKKIFAKETLDKSISFYNGINSLLIKEGIEINEDIILHDSFKKAVMSGKYEGSDIKAFIRTGEFTFYGNVILIAGVDFS